MRFSEKLKVEDNRKEANAGTSASAIAIASQPQVKTGDVMMNCQWEQERSTVNLVVSVGTSFTAGTHTVLKAGISADTIWISVRVSADIHSNFNMDLFAIFPHII